jgi:hypothetical protein
LEARDGAGNVTLHLSGRLDTMPFFNSLADLPPANPADRTIVRVGVPGTPPYRFFAWVPRPVPDQGFQVTVKMIDPLGRIGSASAGVPPLPVLPAPALSAVTITASPLRMVARRLAVQWQILSPVEPGQLDAYTLRVTVERPGICGQEPEPLTIQRTLDNVPEVPDTVDLIHTQALTPFNHIVRIQGSQQYLVFLQQSPLFLRFRHPASVSVTLVDPLGQTTTREGSA